MDIDETFDSIVAGFYRAAVCAIGWPEALLPFKQVVSAFGIYLFAIDAAQGLLLFNHYASDSSPEAEFDYVSRYHKIDPRAKYGFETPTGEWMHCWKIFDEAFVASDPFYQDFLIPYGGRYVSGSKLLQEGTVSVMLGVHRGYQQLPLNTEEMRLCARLARHLTDALSFHRANLAR